MKEIKLFNAAQPLRTRIAPSKSKLKLVSSNRINIIPKSEILYLKSDSNYCEVFLLDGRKILCSQTLKSIEAKLKSPHFFRSHQSFVINMHYLKSVSTTISELELEGSVLIPVSRSNKAMLRKKLEIWFD